MKPTDAHYLKNHFLIAMPHLSDPNFAQSLVYLVEHDAHGAMGIVVNQPSELFLSDVLEQLRPDPLPSLYSHSLQVLKGGPVQTDRGFVLHPRGPRFQSTVELDGLSLSTSVDILYSIAEQHPPQQQIIALGYAGWDAGQLENELAQNSWLTCPADPEILFQLPAEFRLGAAAASLGVDLNLLSSQVGHA